MVGETFPGLGIALKESAGQRRGAYASTADGQKLYDEGSFVVKGDCDGTPLQINFTNMKVDVPVASVRCFVRAGNRVVFHDGGGYIKNKATGARINFIAAGGVFYLKLRVHPVNMSESGFARQAR